MIKLESLTKYYPSQLGNQYIFRDLNFTIPEGHNIAILGSNGAGKSTLFRILAGRENTRFIGRVNGVADLALYEEKVREFAELGEKYDLPVRSYSSGMRSRLAFGTCIAIDFDTYLIDEATSVGDQKFRKKAKQAFLDKSKQANVIMVSHEIKEIKEFCDSAIVLHQGELTFYADLQQGLDVYSAL